MSVEEYLALERERETRHELVDGYLSAMAGASDRHEEIVANLLSALHRHLRGSSCRVYGSSLKIRVGDDFLYPGPVRALLGGKGRPLFQFKTDPLRVIKVLSPGTQRIWQG